jgi:hypothetical protein
MIGRGQVQDGEKAEELVEGAGDSDCKILVFRDLKSHDE